MTRLRVLIAVALLGVANSASAQSTGDGMRGSTPPGTSRDGSKPSEGAITGGSILPGEKSGVPADRAISRCNELSGTLREQCLLQEQGASTGGTRSPPAIEQPKPEPRISPPPQNPR
jgi:hypothetical protein